MIKAIAFDLDGLLIDSEPLWFQANVNIFNNMGLPWDKLDQQNTTGISLSECAEYMSKKTKNQISVNKMRDLLVDQMIGLLDNQVPLQRGVDTVLEALSPFPLAITSSSPQIIIQKVIEKMDWYSHFSFLLSCDDVVKCKPFPDIYEYACGCFGIQPNQLLVFEDSSNGIMAAYYAGAKIIAVPNKDIPPSDESLKKANLVIESLDDFSINLIESLDASGEHG